MQTFMILQHVWQRINYKPERKIDKALIEELSTNQYIEEGLNVVIAGASGCGNYVS